MCSICFNTALLTRLEISFNQKTTRMDHGPIILQIKDLDQSYNMLENGPIILQMEDWTNHITC